MQIRESDRAAAGARSAVRRLVQTLRQQLRPVTDEDSAAHARRRAPRVLLVDDDASSRALYSVNLRLAGIEVLEAEDGWRGLERARRERPDLVVLDVMMPGLNGFELARALRGSRRTRSIPFMFVTGEDEVRNAGRARELGAVDYVKKPADPTTFVSRISALLAPLAGGREQSVA